MRRFFHLLILLLLMGCAASQPASPTQPARTSLPSTAGEAYDTLLNFFTSLHTRKYTGAVALYGGEYEQLQVFNPEIDPADHVALWTWACENQLLRCLDVRSATFKELRGDTYVFQVEFNNPDGSLFVLGPCCGANETEMPPVSQFDYEVATMPAGKFVVLNLPPYVP